MTDYVVVFRRPIGWLVDVRDMFHHFLEEGELRLGMRVGEKEE